MKKIFRKRNSDIGGVCSGIAEYFNIDDIIVKLIFVALIFTPFPIILLYILFWFIIPKEPI